MAFGLQPIDKPPHLPNNYPHLNEQQLVSAVQSRSPEAFSMLYDRYAPALYGIIQRIIQNEEAAEEVLQAGFLKIWEKITEYDPSRSPLFAWLLNIIRPAAIEKVKTAGNEEPRLRRGCRGETADEAFNMIWCGGFSSAETAKALGITEEEVRLRIRKTIKELQLSKA